MPVIAVATDFSTRSDRALARASMLAKKHGAEILLIHVIDDDQPSSVINVHRAEADKLLDSLDRSVRDLTGVSSRSEVRLGDPFHEIASAAVEAGARLLVTGPHRRQLLRDQFRGTTVERSIRRSRIPVLVANSVPAGDYDKVLLTTDLGTQSAQALAKALSLRFLEGSDFVLAHVFEPFARAALGRAMISGDEMDAYLADERANAEAELREFTQATRLDGIRPVVRPVHRSIETDLLAMAAKEGADLVVVGSGQKKFLQSVMLGSVAEGVLRDAECDVLVIPGSVTATPGGVSAD